MTNETIPAAQELSSLAQKIKAWQEAKGLSTSAMLRRFGGLGSDKTYNKILRGDLSEMDVDRQLANYRAAAALIEAVGEDASTAEDFYDDLSTVVRLRRALMEAFVETGNARFILVQGDSGAGKTSAARALITKYGTRLVFVELSPVFGDSPYNFLCLILESLGFRGSVTQAKAAYDKVVHELCQQRRCIIVDELHHAGPRILNTIKSLINATPGEFVGLTMPTLWHRLEKNAYEECRQLVGNRLAERIQIDQINRADLAKFVSRRLPGLNGATPQALKLMEAAARGRGNLAFVRDVCRRALERYEGEKITIEDFAAVVREEQLSR